MIDTIENLSYFLMPINSPSFEPFIYTAMILKTNFNIFVIARYTRTELIILTITSVSAYWLYAVGIGATLIVPFSVSAMIGSGLAIFLAFRNNSSYARWWEARTLWGNITASARVLARLILTFTDSHEHQQSYDRPRSEAFKQRMIYLLIAYIHALRVHLRRESNWQSLEHLLSEDDYTAMLHAHNKPLCLQTRIGMQIYTAMGNGTLGGFDSFQMEGQLLALATYQSGCERIQQTPLLRQYHYFTRVFLFAFMGLLPLSVVAECSRVGAGWLSIPISMIVLFIFATMSKVGEVNEDPFENRITDVPLTALCTMIERDLRDILGEKELPPAVEPQKGYLH